MIERERELIALLTSKYPEADTDKVGKVAAMLAYELALTGRFCDPAHASPTKVAERLDQVNKVARRLGELLDGLPMAARFGLHLKLTKLDMPAPAARAAVLREMVYRTGATAPVGLHDRRAGVAEIAEMAVQVAAEVRKRGRGRHEARRFSEAAADAHVILTNRPWPPISGTGSGRYVHLVEYLLHAAGIKGASATDVARIVADRRRTAAIDGGKKTSEGAKISTRRARRM
jgi:hypothetical protein